MELIKELTIILEKLHETSFLTTFASPILFALDERDVEKILEPLDEDVMDGKDYEELRDMLGSWITSEDFNVDFIVDEARRLVKDKNDRAVKQALDDLEENASTIQKKIHLDVLAKTIEADGNESELHKYVRNELKGLVKLIRFRVREGKHGAMTLYSDVVTSKKLDKTEEDKVAKYLIGQFSDGWGEGLEQQPLNGGPRDARILAKVWWSDSDKNVQSHQRHWWIKKIPSPVEVDVAVKKILGEAVGFIQTYSHDSHKIPSIGEDKKTKKYFIYENVIIEGWRKDAPTKSFTADASDLDHLGHDPKCPKCQKPIKYTKELDKKYSDDADHELTHWEGTHSCGQKLTVWND